MTSFTGSSLRRKYRVQVVATARAPANVMSEHLPLIGSTSAGAAAASIHRTNTLHHNKSRGAPCEDRRKAVFTQLP